MATCSGMTQACNARPTLRSPASAPDAAHAAARYAQQSDHLAFELVKAHQVERILQHAAVTAVIFRRGENDALRALHFIAQPRHILGEFVVAVAAVTEHELVVAQINQLRFRAVFPCPAQCDGQRHARVTPFAQAAADANDFDFVAHCLKTISVGKQRV